MREREHHDESVWPTGSSEAKSLLRWDWKMRSTKNFDLPTYSLHVKETWDLIQSAFCNDPVCIEKFPLHVPQEVENFDGWAVLEILSSRTNFFYWYLLLVLACIWTFCMWEYWNLLMQIPCASPLVLLWCNRMHQRKLYTLGQNRFWCHIQVFRPVQCAPVWFDEFFEKNQVQKFPIKNSHVDENSNATSDKILPQCAVQSIVYRYSWQIEGLQSWDYLSIHMTQIPSFNDIY